MEYCTILIIKIPFDFAEAEQSRAWLLNKFGGVVYSVRSGILLRDWLIGYLPTHIRI